MSSVDDLINRIAKEKQNVIQEKYSAEGLAKLKEIAKSYDGEFKLVWSDDLLEEIQKRPVVEAHKSGLLKLDEITGGFKEKQLIVLSAHTKHGKTAMALFLMDRLNKLNPVLIPLEQSNEELVQQLHDNGYKIPRFLSPKRLATRVSVDWIEERVVEGIAKYNSKFVVIDHLGYIDDNGGNGKYAKENLAYRIGRIMQDLKNIAKKWDVVVLVLVHISQTDDIKPPTIKDLKGSSSIGQESDKVILLWRKSTAHGKVRIYENKTMVSVVLNRQTGKTGSVGLEFDVATGLYIENNGWVESMEKMAQREVDVSSQFDNF